MRTLVLNKAWLAIGHVSWKRAFTLLVSERAEVLEYYEATIRTPRDELFVPAVIRLFNYDKIPVCKVTFSKRSILERDNFQCQYCGVSLTNNNATLDHVMPRSLGGPTNFINTVASCQPCNNKKSNKLLKDTSLNLRKKPFKPIKKSFKLSLPKLEEEWKDYLPRKIVNEFQARNRNR